MDGITRALEKEFNGGPAFGHGRDSSTTPVQPIPFSLYRKPDRSDDDPLRDDVQSPSSSKSSQPPTSHGSGMSISWNSNSPTIGGYDKLNKGDFGYGGNIFAGSPDGKQVVAEGLLAKKLRDLGVGIPSQRDNDI
jgi:hypothetical protein